MAPIPPPDADRGLFSSTPILLLLPPQYDPAPSRNAIWTVVAVFAFFGTCFIVAATWMRCVTAVEDLQSRCDEPDIRERRRRKGRGGGFQEWYRRRRLTFRGSQQSPSLPPSSRALRRSSDTKYWGSNKNNPTSTRAPLLVPSNSSSQPNVYDTFSDSRGIPKVPGQNRNRYNGDSSPDPSPLGSYRSLAHHSSKPPSLSGSPSCRDQTKRSWIMSTPPGNKVSKSSRPPKPYGSGVRNFTRISTRRKGRGGGREGGDGGSNRRDLPVKGWSDLNFTVRGGGLGYGVGLDVVFEEAGSTPEK